ncbi:MAG: GntR family transcriptional regulator [Chloroflexota bacterium]
MYIIDRDSFKPLYYQISEIMREKIDDDEWKPGDRVWSERDLTNQFQVSRNTAREALDVLVKEGLIYRMRGHGSFVAPRKMRHGLLSLTSFSETMLSRGVTPSSRLMAMELLVPPPRIAEHLRLDQGQKAFRIERLRLGDGDPMALNISYVPQHLCPHLDRVDLETGSLYRLLEGEYGLRLWRSEQVLKPTVATEYEAQLLDVSPGTPLLLAEGTTFLEGDVPIEYSKLVYRADRYEFTIRATRYAGSQISRGPGA